MNTERYAHWNLEKTNLDRARDFLNTKGDWVTTKKLAEELKISRYRATAIFYRLGWNHWAKNHPNGTTFVRGNE